MGQIGSIIVASTSMALNYAERLLKCVSTEQFARFARPGGVEVKSNHPAWVLGHLALYPERVIELVGGNKSLAGTPANYSDLFKNGVDVQDDPTGKIYPPMQEVTAKFFENYRAAIAAVAGADDAVLLRPNPAEGRMKELFPILAGAINFYISGHVQMHLGQLSAWRRMMGMPPA